MDIWPYIWVAVMVLLVIAEGLTAQLVSVWFAVGALAAAIVSFFVPVVPIQFGVFVIVSLLFLLLTKPLVQKSRKIDPEPTNADRNIGKTAIVTREINNVEGTGQVKLGGNTWTARSVNGSVVPEGTKVTVKEISGVKLMVLPESKV